MANQAQPQPQSRNGVISAAIVILAGVTLAPILLVFWKWLLGMGVPWDGAEQATSRVGFGIVVMGAVVACCILLLRLRTFPPDQERPAPSLVPGVVIMAIGAMVVSMASYWH
jgi:hypothetical protein